MSARDLRGLVYPIALGAAGFAVNLLPVELFLGVPLIFGSVLSVLAAIWFGPVAGGVAGLIAGLPTWFFWQHPLPWSALLFALEGVWVGYRMRGVERAPITAVLSYWLIAGGWLNLIGQLVIHNFSLRIGLILQARSVVNGLLVGMLVEIAMLSYDVARRRRAKDADEPPRFSLKSLATLIFTVSLTFPLLYISADNVKDVRERMKADLEAATLREVRSVENELIMLLDNHRRGVEMAASLLSSPAHMTDDRGSLLNLLRDIHNQHHAFRAMMVADANGRIVATHSNDSTTVAPFDISGHPFYQQLLDTQSPVLSDVFLPAGSPGPVLAIGARTTDASGSLNGFIIGFFDLDLFHRIATRHHREGGAIVIADREGRLIADSQIDPAGRQEIIELAGRWDYEMVKGMANEPAYHTQTPDRFDPRQRFNIYYTFHIASATLPLARWMIWNRQSLAALADRLEPLYLSNLLVFIVAIVFVIALIDWVLDRFLKPLEGLQRSAAALADGDLSARPQMRFFTTEFHSLFNSFSRMAERIESSWKRQQELLIEASVARGELQATFDAMTDCVIITDREDRVLRANSSYYRLKGAEPEQIEGRSLAEIAHPYDDWRDCSVCLARREGCDIVALKKPAENALQKYLEVRVDPIYSASGERLGAVQILRDLTEEHETRIEAEKASALLRNLVEAAYDAVSATTLDGHFLWANKRALDLFMPHSDRLEGESFFDWVQPDDLARVRESFEMGARGQAQSYEARLVTDDGPTRQVLITSSPVYAGDSIAAVLLVMRDVTEERRAIEQAVRDDKLRAIGQLATGIAHNFNNSLTAVLGYTQLAVSKAADPTMLRHLQTVEAAAMDAARMVQRIQNFARQRRDEPSEPYEINPIIRDALDLTRSRWRDDARAASIEYYIIFKPDVNPIVLCDQAALREIFVNLIINALDAMPRGGRLTIRTDVEADWVLASFTDTGSGITEEVRKRLFEPFYTTKGVKGYGMGLAVAYGIVERHGGEITVASEPGKGAAFTIKLPLFHEPAKPDMDLSEPARAKPSRVLVADDEAPLRALVTDVMRARGHEVTTAEDGSAALKALEEGRFDLLITDLSMPGIDGWTLVRKVRSLWPATRILIMTGYGGLAEMAIPGFDAALVDDFVSKPFDLGELDAKANALLLRNE